MIKALMEMLSVMLSLLMFRVLGEMISPKKCTKNGRVIDVCTCPFFKSTFERAPNKLIGLD